MCPECLEQTKQLILESDYTDVCWRHHWQLALCWHLPSPCNGQCLFNSSLSVCAACNKVLTAPAGRIVSPSWPGSYPINANCQVSIVSPPGYKIALFFAVFRIERHSRCNFDYLAVRQRTFFIWFVYVQCATNIQNVHKFIKAKIQKSKIKRTKIQI